MCEATAYLLGDNEPTLVMEAVDTIEPEEKVFVSPTFLANKNP